MAVRRPEKKHAGQPEEEDKKQAYITANQQQPRPAGLVQISFN